MTDDAEPYLTADDAPEHLNMFPDALEVWVEIVEEEKIPTSKRAALASFCCAQSEIKRTAIAKQLFEDGREHTVWTTTDGEERFHCAWYMQMLAMGESLKALSALGISRRDRIRRERAAQGENIVDFYDFKGIPLPWEEWGIQPPWEEE